MIFVIPQPSGVTSHRIQRNLIRHGSQTGQLSVKSYLGPDTVVVLPRQKIYRIPGIAELIGLLPSPERVQLLLYRLRIILGREKPDIFAEAFQMILFSARKDALAG